MQRFKYAHDLRRLNEQIEELLEVRKFLRTNPTFYKGPTWAGPDRVPTDEAYADWLTPDPSPGNTTVGAGLLFDFTKNPIYLLNETNASSAEVRTLPDPPKAGLLLGFTLQATAGQNVVVRAKTPLWLGSTVTQPALTQFGQFITFGTINHSIFLQSVFCVSGTSFAGTQTNPTVNVTGARWMVISSDGPTVT